MGGPSIIFHQYHEAGKTKIREKEMEDQGKQAKTCQKIVGYDANALYLWAIMQDMPTGSFTRRREETGFKRESSSRMATEWLEWKAHEGGIFIRHKWTIQKNALVKEKYQWMVFTVLRKQSFSSMAAGGKGIIVILLKENKWTKREKDQWRSY